MKLDSKEQQELLKNCILNAQITGLVQELAPLLRDIGNLINSVESAEIINEAKKE